MTRSHFKGFLFDMDGTLLNTLPDLASVCNQALAAQGYPSRTEEEIRTFIGNGVLRLATLAVPEGTDDDHIERVYRSFCELYAQDGAELTREFEGMGDVLRTLRAQGKKLGIVSNKFEDGVKMVEAKFFPGLFDASHGESATIERKPSPSGLLACAREMALDPSECVYFGDSAGDMLAAHNAGMYAVGVTWGYQSLQKLGTGKPDELIDQVSDILRFV